MTSDVRRPKQILVLVSHPELKAQLENLAFLHDEFLIERSEDNNEALKLASEDRFDIILLDNQFLDMDGHLICRLLRNKGVKCAIIILSASASDSEAVLALEAGASDFVASPLNRKTFVARLRANARHLERDNLPTFEFGPYRFQFLDDSLINVEQNSRVRLTRAEALLLRCLCLRRGYTVHRKVLLKSVWNLEEDSDSHTLATHIYRLRRKLEPAPRRPVFILRMPSGYRIGDTY